MEAVITLPRRCAVCHGPILLPEPSNGHPRKYCSMNCASIAGNRPKHRTRCPECKSALICPECGWQPPD